MVVEGHYGLVALELGSWRAMNGNGVIGDDCFEGPDVDLLLTRTTIIDFFVSLRVLVLSQRLLGIPVP